MRILFKSIALKIIMLIIVLFFCHCKKNDIQEVFNDSPKYNKEKFISLDKLYSINVTDLTMIRPRMLLECESVIDFDENNNLYILDTDQCSITVFNNKGERIRNFGKPGKGPEDFNRPYYMILKGEKIYIFESGHTYKIIDLEGTYLTSKTMPVSNYLKIKLIEDNFYVFEGKTDRTFSDLDFILNIKGKILFSQKNQIFKYKFLSGLDGPYYEFIYANWILITDNGEFYFPEKIFNNYSIIKYDKEGTPLLKFKRGYKTKKYSKSAKERFYSFYKNSRDNLEFPESPPVVRRMIQDDRGNIWIIYGETYMDNRDPDYKNSIDIFSEEGEWLYSFKSDVITKNVMHNDGNLYVVSPIDEETYEQFIDVYEINYESL